jgi:hypothetical protein
MTPEIAKIALQFMARVDLKGQEVGPFIQVTNALVAIAGPNNGATSPAVAEAVGAAVDGQPVAKKTRAPRN